MLAKLKTFSLLGIDALPVEVEVDVSPADCRKPFWSACRRRRSRKVRIGSNGRSSTQASNARKIESLSIWLRPICPKRPLRSICRSRWAFSPVAGRLAAERLHRLRRRRRVGPRRHDSADQGRALDGHGCGRAGRSCAECSCPAASAAEAAVVEGVEVIPVASLAQAVAFLTGRDRDRAAAFAARRTVPHAIRLTTSISPTCAARRWPSGR